MSYQLLDKGGMVMSELLELRFLCEGEGQCSLLFVLFVFAGDELAAFAAEGAQELEVTLMALAGSRI
jgi:hypothetical protein